MPKVFVSPGHGGSDTGAVGFVVEKDVNLKMAKACATYLSKRGIEVLLSRSEDGNESLNEKIKKCNDFNPDVAVECHNNAGNGNGFEIYHSIVGGVGKNLANNIEEEIIKINQNSRGLKTRVGSNGTDYFAFIRQTNCPAVICEGAFVDNVEDVKMIDTDEKCTRFGVAYAKGILKTLGIKDENVDDGKSENTPGQDAKQPYLVKVTTDGLNIRSGPGTSYPVVGLITDRGVYTIVDFKTVSGIIWGKLKSGAGWIALSYTTTI
ncbi:MAG: N-acetylmuramoyl-L-alanine amidase [Lachnospiraceae bacterium]|nr:N-acetylmuramoyl-L-alanine amidase [Lachnospiraceae bacterium]